MMLTTVLLFAGLVGLGQACQNIDAAQCNGNTNCRCMSIENPGGFTFSQLPQLVMLTFDDAVSQINFVPTFNDLFLGERKNPSKCNIGGTFFLSHEYTNYAQVHHLWRAGSEMAVHTITHETSTEMWKRADYQRWKNEAVGMRDMIAKYAQIPKDDIKGFRAPFLQTAGDTTFQMLKQEGFTYDSSLVTRQHSGENDSENPTWPYTLDDGFHMDCVILPCPKSSFPGLWEIPLITFFRKRVIIDGAEPVRMPCSMVDACLPHPITQADTFGYLMENFNRHYLKNKAPFPVFLHESWLKDPERKAGYLQFVGELLQKKDVFLVTASEVIEYMKNPKPYAEYKEKRCVTEPAAEACSLSGKYCNYKNTILGGPRIMTTCEGSCPITYPWLNNIS